MAKRQMTVRIDAELVAEVRRVIGPLGLMTETVTEALQLWLASKRASGVSVHAAADESPALPWNAYRPPRSAQT